MGHLEDAPSLEGTYSASATRYGAGVLPLSRPSIHRTDGKGRNLLPTKCPKIGHVDDASALAVKYGWEAGSKRKAPLMSLKAKRRGWWQCAHLYPVVVMSVEGGGRRARCTNCGVLGPVHVGLGEAMRALREVRWALAEAPRELSKGPAPSMTCRT